MSFRFHAFLAAFALAACQPAAPDDYETETAPMAEPPATITPPADPSTTPPPPVMTPKPPVDGRPPAEVQPTPTLPPEGQATSPAAGEPNPDTLGEG